MSCARIARFDRQFEQVFGVPVDQYWYGIASGLDIVRFDEEVLHSGDRPVSAAVQERVAAHFHGLQAQELVEYIRRLL
jgi:hypothetical protein